MTVLNYMKAQTDKILSRHGDRVYAQNRVEAGKSPSYKSAWEILAEINAMHGLNVEERIDETTFIPNFLNKSFSPCHR